MCGVGMGCGGGGRVVGWCGEVCGVGMGWAWGVGVGWVWGVMVCRAWMGGVWCWHWVWSGGPG